MSELSERITISLDKKLKNEIDATVAKTSLTSSFIIRKCIELSLPIIKEKFAIKEVNVK
jgi:metal-responsive CopG/Arc/MetJ family transcriptional regulator